MMPWSIAPDNGEMDGECHVSARGETNGEGEEEAEVGEDISSHKGDIYHG